MKNKKYIFIFTICFIILSVIPVKAQEVKLSYQQVKVNGQSFNVVNYVINNQSYIRIRDIAFLLKNTDKRFNTEYDSKSREIIIKAGQNYIDENKFVIYADSADAVKSTSKIRYENRIENLDSYNIKGYNYYRIEDIAKMLNFSTEYEINPGIIIINTIENKGVANGSKFILDHFSV